MIDRIRLRRDIADNWTLYNPILASGEPGVELDTNRLKVGNGTQSWSSLPYLLGNLSGLVLNIGDGFATGVQWDIGNRLDVKGSGDTQIILNDSDQSITIFSSGTLPPATYSYIVSGLGYVPQISGDYASLVHNHNISDVSGLQEILNTKQPSGQYANLVHFHQLSDISGLIGALNNKQPLGSYASADHTHTLFISNGFSNVISYVNTEPLKILGSGIISIGFNNLTKTIIIGSSGVSQTFGSVNIDQILFKDSNNNIVGDNSLKYEKNNELLKVNNFVASGTIAGIIDGGVVI